MAKDQSLEYTIRNREHQRRSRARRKDYITELEKRVRQYEEQGARATVEVQSAARRVAEENRYLHTLLQKHGISTTDYHHRGYDGAQKLGELLAENPHTPNFSGSASERELQFAPTVVTRSSHSAIDVSTPGLQGQLPVTQTERAKLQELRAYHPAAFPDPQQQMRAYSMPSTDPSIERTTTVSRTICMQDGIDEAHTSPTSATTSNNSFTGSDLLRTTRDDPQVEEARLLASWRMSLEPQKCMEGTDLSGDETTCEDAARIISSMRGNVDPESLWPELGCAQERKCKVKNIRIFQLS